MAAEAMHQDLPEADFLRLGSTSFPTFDSMRLFYVMLTLVTVSCGGATQCTSCSTVKFFQRPDSIAFLIAGQSNGVSPAQEHEPYWSQTGKVSITDFYHGKDLRIPTKEDPLDSGIAWIYLGDAMNRDVTFVNIARGNQSTSTWSLQHLEKLLVPALRERKFHAVLWHQGESDWNELIPEETSYQNMKNLIIRSREIQPGLVWFVALNSMRGAPENAPIRNAQKRIIKEGLANQGPDTDTLRTNPAWIEKTGGEFVGEGLKQHGLLWYEALKNHFPPQAAAAAK